jgi:hypothetical protein
MWRFATALLAHNSVAVAHDSQYIVQHDTLCCIIAPSRYLHYIRPVTESTAAPTTAATAAAATAAATAAVDRRGRGRGKLRGLASLPYGGLSRTGGHKLLIERTAFCTAVLTLTSTASSTAAIHSGAAAAGDAATTTCNSGSATAACQAAAGKAASAADDHGHSCNGHTNSSSQCSESTHMPAVDVYSAATELAADSDDILLSYFMAAAPTTAAASAATAAASAAAAEQSAVSTEDSAVAAHYTLYAALIGQRLQQRLTGVHERTAKDALWSCTRSVIETTVSATTATATSVTAATDSSTTKLEACACAAHAQQQPYHQCGNGSNSSSTVSSSSSAGSGSSSDSERQYRLQHVVRLLLCTCTALKPLLGLGGRALVKLAALMFEGLRDCTLPRIGKTTTTHARSCLLVHFLLAHVMAMQCRCQLSLNALTVCECMSTCVLASTCKHSA